MKTRDAKLLTEHSEGHVRAQHPSGAAHVTLSVPRVNSFAALIGRDVTLAMRQVNATIFPVLLSP